MFGFASVEVGQPTVKFRLNSLVLSYRCAEVTIDFADVSYFWGQMGAGKTSIARLVDYWRRNPAIAGDAERVCRSGSQPVARPRGSENAPWGISDPPAFGRSPLAVPRAHVANLTMYICMLAP